MSVKQLSNNYMDMQCTQASNARAMGIMGFNCHCSSNMHYGINAIMGNSNLDHL